MKRTRIQGIQTSGVIVELDDSDENQTDEEYWQGWHEFYGGLSSLGDLSLDDIALDDLSAIPEVKSNAPVQPIAPAASPYRLWKCPECRKLNQSLIATEYKCRCRWEENTVTEEQLQREYPETSGNYPVPRTDAEIIKYTYDMYDLVFQQMFSPETVELIKKRNEDIRRENEERLEQHRKELEENPWLPF